MRPTWDETWMSVAQVIAQRSRCVRRQIGAVITSADNQLLAVGYNSPPRGIPDALDNTTMCDSFCPRARYGTPERDALGHYDNCVSVHAEMNALSQVDNRAQLIGGSVYVPSAMCWDCAKVVANQRLRRVVMRVNWQADAHREPRKVIRLLRTAGLEVEIWAF